MKSLTLKVLIVGLMFLSGAMVTHAKNPVSIHGRIVFQSDHETQDDNKTQLYSINVDGTNLTRLTNDSFDNWFPSISPDGKSIAFQSDRAGDWALFTMDIDGTNLIQRTHGVHVNYPVAWSPEGTKVAITSDFDVYIMKIDGSDLVNLTNNKANDQRPSWSPDNKHIAFGSSRDNFTTINTDNLDIPSSDNQIYIMNTDGSEPKRLTSYLNTCTFPEWSPDGQSIAFARLGGDASGLYVMNTDGSNVRRVSSQGFMSSWSADSQYLAFTDGSTSVSTLYVVNVASGELFSVTSLEGYIAYPSWGP